MDELLHHLPHLEALQHHILHRIRALEQSLSRQSTLDNHWVAVTGPSDGQLNLDVNFQIRSGLHQESTEKKNGSNLCSHAGLPTETVQERLERIMLQAGVTSFQFRRVPADYYDRPFEERRRLLGAASVDHLCKSIVMVNTQAHESVNGCNNFSNSKYYVVVVQYTARLNAEKVKNFIYLLNDGKIPKKRFNMRLAPEDEAYNLTGFAHNAVTPIGMNTKIPVILSDIITGLNPPFFWLGAGDVDLKLGIDTHQFIEMFNPFIADCTY